MNSSVVFKDVTVDFTKSVVTGVTADVSVVTGVSKAEIADTSDGFFDIVVVAIVETVLCAVVVAISGVVVVNSTSAVVVICVFLVETVVSSPCIVVIGICEVVIVEVVSSLVVCVSEVVIVDSNKVSEVVSLVDASTETVAAVDDKSS